MSKEFILVKNEDDSGLMLLRVSAIVAAKDHTADEKSRRTVGGKSRIWMTSGAADDSVDSDSSAAEIFALIEGEQEKPPRYTVSDEEQKRAIEGHSSSPASSSDARRAIENVATLCPDLRSELGRLTGETWIVRLLPVNANFDETGVFTVRWIFRCFQEKTQFQYALPEHYLSYWIDMSDVAREKWVIEATLAVISKWRTSSGY